MVQKWYIFLKCSKSRTTLEHHLVLLLCIDWMLRNAGSTLSFSLSLSLPLSLPLSLSLSLALSVYADQVAEIPRTLSLGACSLNADQVVDTCRALHGRRPSGWIPCVISLADADQVTNVPRTPHFGLPVFFPGRTDQVSRRFVKKRNFGTEIRVFPGNSAPEQKVSLLRPTLFFDSAQTIFAFRVCIFEITFFCNFPPNGWS